MALLFQGYPTGRREPCGSHRQTQRGDNHLPRLHLPEGASKPEDHPRCLPHHRRQHRDALQVATCSSLSFISIRSNLFYDLLELAVPS